METTHSKGSNPPPYKLQHPLTPHEFDSMMHTARIASKFMRQEFQRLLEQQTPESN